MKLRDYLPLMILFLTSICLSILSLYYTSHYSNRLSMTLSILALVFHFVAWSLGVSTFFQIIRELNFGTYYGKIISPDLFCTFGKGLYISGVAWIFLLITSFMQIRIFRLQKIGKVVQYTANDSMTTIIPLSRTSATSRLVGI